MKKTRVLFLCTANSARSQMAEAFVRRYAGDRMEVYSAGLEPTEINPLTVKVMNEIGVSLVGQYAKDVALYMGQLHFGYLITVCSDADRNCPSTFPGVGQRLHWALQDPAHLQGSEEAKLDKFRQVRDEIDSLVKGWLQELNMQEAAAVNL